MQAKLSHETPFDTLFGNDCHGGEVLRSQDFTTIFNIKSEPLVADGKLFIGTSHDGFLAVNLDDFSTAWTFETKAPLILTSPYTKGGEKTVECSPATSSAMISPFSNVQGICSTT